MSGVSDSLRRRLRQLGVVQGTQELASLPKRRQVAIEDLVEGMLHTTAHGRCFVAEEIYPYDHRHGDLQLSDFLSLANETVAEVGGDHALAAVDLERACFLDTETTGLSAGTGTMAFIIGLGFFTDEGFSVQQFFLRDPGDEPSMIEVLAERLAGFEALVSFNGLTFDVPIVENRFILARRPPPTAGLPHLDLLHPARRLWRYSLSSCRLGMLESHVLGVYREQADVPSGVIPYLYRDYLRTGDAREMQRVLYHNAIDILSLVTLATRLCRAFEDPWHHGPGLNGAELYGLGRWYAAEKRTAEAERAFRSALQDDMDQEVRERALQSLALILKQADRRPEAVEFWQQAALENEQETQACVELAKYYEWHGDDLNLALSWTCEGLAHVSRWPAGMDQEVERQELTHRRERLERKLSDQRDETASDS